jgi:large subunit ribosomal protein L16
MYPPKRTKYRKQQKGRAQSVESNQSDASFGKYAIRALKSGRLRLNTIEAVRRVITRKLKRSGQVWIRVYPDISVSAKPLEVRMGKGKGAPSYWMCRIKAGQLLYEIDGVSHILAKQAFLLAASKLPFTVRFSTSN